MNWVDVSNLVLYYKSLGVSSFEEIDTLFTRSKDVHEAYENNKLNKSDMTDLIFSETLEKVVLRENEYPYEIDDSIKHFVLWFHPDHYEEVPNNVDGLLDTMVQTNNKVWYQNPTKWQSVKTIPHVHVFLIVESHVYD